MYSPLKKTFLIFALIPAFLLLAAAFVLAVPNPGGKAKIRSTIPYQYVPIAPSGVSNLTGAYPSNRWFTSYVHVPEGVVDTQYNLTAHPLNYKFKNPLYVELGCPSYDAAPSGVYRNTTDYFADISASTTTSVDTVTNYTTVVSTYSDWTVTLKRTANSDNSKWFTTTIGRGMLFTNFKYSSGLNPVIQYGSSWGGDFTFYDSNGTVMALNATPVPADSIMVRSQIGSSITHFFGVFAPPNTKFSYDSAKKALTVQFDSSLAADKRLLSIGYIQRYDENPVSVSAKFKNMYKYAYNFITGTASSYEVDHNNLTVTTKFAFAFDRQRTGSEYNEGTIFALFPHQWRNISKVGDTNQTASSINGIVISTFSSIRGTLKAVAAGKFEVTNNFDGMLPSLTYEVPESYRGALQSYINVDKNFSPANIGNPDIGNAPAQDTYYCGRGLGKAAVLIPLLHQFGDIESRNSMIANVKSELEKWYTDNGQASKYFAFDSSWSGLMGINPSHSLDNYNDHHFHYGYFVYASAILALFDPDFAKASQYKGMVDLIIRDYNGPDRNDAYFPYLRCLDVYSGHSWANGMGGWNDEVTGKGYGNNAVDQESSGEAMNSWTAIYLWGIATNNQQFIDLGIYGYTTEYTAVQEYYLDTTGENYAGFGAYNHNSVGILWDDAIEYLVLWRPPYQQWTPLYPQEIKGVQVMPLTPSMLYLGNDKTYAQNFYSAMSSEASNDPSYWADIWSRFMAFFNPDAALTLLNNNAATLNQNAYKEATTTSFSYYFIHFFRTLGNIATLKNGSYDYYASGNPSFAVMDKGGTKTYMAFNNSRTSYKTVDFRSRQSGLEGSVKVPPMTTASTKDFVNFKYDSLRTLYSSGNDYALLMDNYADKISISSVPVPAIDDTYYKTLSFAFTVNAASSTLDNITAYVNCSGVSIPAGYTVSQVSVAVYNPSRELPERVFPAQVFMEKTESGGYADFLIRSTFTKTGTYVLVIPTGVEPPGSVLVSGTLVNEADGSDITAKVYIYDEVNKSTDSAVFTGAYAFEADDELTYTITPEAPGYMFTPKNFRFTVVSGQSLTKNFKASKIYPVTGQIILGGAKPLDKISVNIYDTVSKSTAVSVTSGGNYLGNIVYGRNYVITPVSQDYDFSPSSLVFNYVTGPVAQANFYASIAAGRFVVYPNPYKPSKHGNVGITFNGLKNGAEIKIYNIAGELAFETKTSVDGAYVWDSGNNSGNQVGSGVYIYYIKSGGKTHKGKFAIER